MKRSVLIFFAAIGIAGCVYLWLRPSSTAAREGLQQESYYCPMHPGYTSSKPGNCPICGMNLVRKTLQYESERSPAGTINENSNGNSELVSGRVPVKVNREGQQRMGLTTVPVQRMDLDRSIETTGYVSSTTVDVHARFSGTVQEVYAKPDTTDAIWTEKGARLVSITSPEFTALQNNYLVALQSSSTEPEKLAAAKNKLSMAGLPEQEIQTLERTRQPLPALTIYSPVSGRPVFMTSPGTVVSSESSVCSLLDLSHLSVLASVAATEVSSIQAGMAAEATFPDQPGRIWKGKVANSLPQFDERSQTLKIKVELENNSKLIWPGMLAEVRLRNKLRAKIAIPESALLSDGKRSIVYVAAADDTFVPREVQVGYRGRQAVEIIQGLKEGDQVVVSANFLLDSESKLRAEALSRSTP